MQKSLNHFEHVKTIVHVLLNLLKINGSNAPADAMPGRGEMFLTSMARNPNAEPFQFNTPGGVC